MKVRDAAKARRFLWCVGLCAVSMMLAGCLYVGDSWVEMTVVNECPRIVTAAVY